MAWYDGTHSCGHEGSKRISGTSKEREWKYDYYFSNLCDKCKEEKYKEERAKKLLVALEKAQEMDLPNLTGSDRQINWANTLRIEYLEWIEKIINQIEDTKTAKNIVSDIEKQYFSVSGIDIFNISKKFKIMKDYLIQNEINSSFWINNRFKELDDLIKIFISIDKKMEIEKEENLIPEDIQEEATVLPEKLLFGIVEISYVAGYIKAIYDKDDTFIKIMKKNKFFWNPERKYWNKKITERTGSYEDRAGEIGSMLLNQGFGIKILDEIALEKAINASFEKEETRWIYSKGENYAAINWNHEIDGFQTIYKNAKKITGAYWENPSVIVNIKYFDQIEDFAEIYDFKLTKKVQEQIEKEKSKIGKYKKVTPEKQQPSKVEDMLKLEKKLHRENLVISDLLD